MTPSTPDADPARVVIDANVWISALVFGGPPRRVIEQLVRLGERVMISAETLTEVRRIVAAKFPDFVDDAESLFVALGDHLEVVTLGSLTVDVCRDPDDNRVLETAVLGGVSAIVTGHGDLLVLEEFEGIRIVRPADWPSS